MFPALRSMQSFSLNRAPFIDALSLGPETRRDLCKTTKARTVGQNQLLHGTSKQIYLRLIAVFISLLFDFVIQNVIP